MLTPGTQFLQERGEVLDLSAIRKGTWLRPRLPGWPRPLLPTIIHQGSEIAGSELDVIIASEGADNHLSVKRQTRGFDSSVGCRGRGERRSEQSFVPHM